MGGIKSIPPTLRSFNRGALAPPNQGDYCLTSSKETFRKHFLSVRRAIKALRREEARRSVLYYLKVTLEEASVVLSYAPTPEEVDMGALNEYLAEKGCLALPKVEEHELHAYRVRDLAQDVKRGEYKFFEPIPERCERVEKIDVVLVPGIVFDTAGNRVGFGIGHYDRFLAQRVECKSIGIAFREQLVEGGLPTFDHDIKMSQMCIV